MKKEVKVNVNCFQYENYGNIFYEGPEEWKLNGTFRFSFMVDIEDYFYDTEKIVETFKMVIESKNNSTYRYEYLNHGMEIETQWDITEDVKLLYMLKKGV
jgi:hypothetical protein